MLLLASVVSDFGVLAETVHPGARLEVTHVRVDAAGPVVTPGAFRRAAATRRSVVVVTHTVSVELGAFPLHLHSPSRGIGASASFSASPPTAVVARCILAGGRPWLVGGPLLHHLVPAVPCLSARERRVPGECAPRVFSEETVYELAQNPATIRGELGVNSI